MLIFFPYLSNTMANAIVRITSTLIRKKRWTQHY